MSLKLRVRSKKFGALLEMGSSSTFFLLPLLVNDELGVAREDLKCSERWDF